MQMTLFSADIIPQGTLKWDSCTFAPKSNAKGTFSAQIVPGVSKRDVSKRIVEGCRILVEDEGVSYSGRITKITRAREENGERTLQISGVDDIALLGDRVTYPDPSRPATQQTEEAYYKDSGPAARVICSMVTRNMGASALEVRREANFVVDATSVGGTVRVNSRFKPMLDEIAAAATAGNVRLVCRQRADRKVHFAVVTQRDRSRSVVFRQRTGVVGAYEVSISEPEATAVIVAGQGEGTDRRVLEYNLPASDTWGRRIEVVKDQRNTAEDADLDQAGQEMLDESIGSAAISINVTEGAKRLGIDYNLGDLVSVQLDGIMRTDRIQAAEVSWDVDGRTVALTIGTSQDQDAKSPTWVREIRKLQARQRNLETE